MQQKLLPIILFVSMAFYGSGQSLDSLSKLQRQSFTVYYSDTHQKRAANIASLVEKAIDYNESILDFRPSITLLVLNEKDWGIYTVDPLVYGMPHYNEKNKFLIVAAEDNPFWKSFLPALDKLPADLREQFKSAYSSGQGEFSMQPFFDLLALHELGHAFHFQAGLTMQRKWMGELFSNILLHTFIAEKVPDLLPALVIFPRMVVAGGTEGFLYTSLKDLEEKYFEIGSKHPRNYGWYQSRWHVAAAEIYDAGGPKVLQRLWAALKAKPEVMDDKALGNYLRTVDTTLANVMLQWDK